MSFTHLHVASSFSLRHGSTTPEGLVERAAELGQGRLALTDRDGLYGSVRFARACQKAGVDPLLGVDLALDEHAGHTRPPAAAPRTPAKGGAVLDDRRPRVTVLALGEGAGVPTGAGYAALCRLVTRAHLGQERGRPAVTPEVLAEHAAADGPGVGAPPRHRVDGSGPVGGRSGLPSTGPRLAMLLGPDSDVGRALRAGQAEHARLLLGRWARLLPEGSLVLEVVCHDGPSESVASRTHAARLLGLAVEHRLPAVLTAWARCARAEDAAVLDVLDAARRGTVLDERHLDRVTTRGHLLDAAAMADVAERVARAVGTCAAPALGDQAWPQEAAGRARLLLDLTERLAERAVLRPRTDMGLGSVHLPEPEVLGVSGAEEAMARLEHRCRGAVAWRYPGRSGAELDAVHARLDEELATIRTLGYPTYFLTVSQVVDLIRDNGVRVAARGSGAGSLVNFLLGISGVDPMAYGLLMERFCTTLRAQLPDIDIDVESARRTEMYERILETFGSERVTCVSMMETYRVRHAVRDVGSALGFTPHEVDEIAKAFPHVSARHARTAIAELPELRSAGLDSPRLDLMFSLVERLDGLPRHVALHPCGVLLSSATLLDRTAVEASWLGFPMSQLDKEDVEHMGLLKLDVLGIRMQSAMAHATAEIARTEAVELDLEAVPLDDAETFALIDSTHTLGCFQIESPGQRELIGKFAPRTFEDIVIDISLFRPGPVKSDMISPFLMARQGWQERRRLHASLEPYLDSTEGVVVFHEQILQIVAETAGVSLAEADEVRRALGRPEGQDQVKAWWVPAAAARGYTAAEQALIWDVLAAFASFGFCKAHAAAFALPTYQSAWLKTYYPAHFLAGVLTHDPGMYPKRLILEDARTHGVEVRGVDVNASRAEYVVERVEEPAEGSDAAGGSDGGGLGESVIGYGPWGPMTGWSRGEDGLADEGVDAEAAVHRVSRRGARYALRLALAEVKGITAEEVARIVAGQPYESLADFWQRAHVSRPVTENLVLVGAFDALHQVRSGTGSGSRGGVTRRDLLLHVAELDRWTRSHGTPKGRRGVVRTASRADIGRLGWDGRPESVGERAAALARGRRPGALAEQGAQLTLDLGDTPELRTGSGLPVMDTGDQVQAELDLLGLDISAHAIDPYKPLLTALGACPARDLVRRRTDQEVLVAGVKVATRTPPVRSGRRVIFLTLDDSTGPSDSTFFEDVQGPYSQVVFHSWLLLVRGIVRRTGPRGVSLRATGAWELSTLEALRVSDGPGAVLDLIAASPGPDTSGRSPLAGPDGRRTLVHPSGFVQSPYADIIPAGDAVKSNPGRKLWHASPGSAGR